MKSKWNVISHVVVSLGVFPGFYFSIFWADGANKQQHGSCCCGIIMLIQPAACTDAQWILRSMPRFVLYRIDTIDRAPQHAPATCDVYSRTFICLNCQSINHSSTGPRHHSNWVSKIPQIVIERENESNLISLLWAPLGFRHTGYTLDAVDVDRSYKVVLSFPYSILNQCIYRPNNGNRKREPRFIYKWIRCWRAFDVFISYTSASYL